MFQESLVGSGAAARKSWSFAISLLAQTLAICLVLLATVAYTPLLPAARFASVILEPPKPPAAQPPAPEHVAVVRPRRFQAELTQPRRIPDRVAAIVDPAEAPRIGSPGVVGATGPGIPGGIIDSIAASVPPPVKPPAPEPPRKPVEAPKGPVAVSSGVQAARLIRRVEPVYPPLAIQARIGGKVRLKAIVSADGAVEQINVLSGHPLLLQAAAKAVQQWRYRPTLLNGRATPVSTEIEVNFVLR